MVAQKVKSFAHLAPEALQLSLRRDDIRAQLFRMDNDMPSLAHGEVTEERHHISGDVEHQHSAQPDVVVDETDDRAGNEKSPLHARQQKGIRLYELSFWSEFLDQCGDGRPEHPETRSDQRIH